MPGKPLFGAKSWSYPYFSIGTAVERLDSLERSYGSEPVSRTLAAQALGYSKAEGPGGAALSALNQYGLLQAAGPGCVRTTGRAHSLLYDDGDHAFRRAARGAARCPRLFRALFAAFGAKRPHRTQVTDWLIEQGYRGRSLDWAANAWLGTLDWLAQNAVNPVALPDDDAGDWSLRVAAQYQGTFVVTWSRPGTPARPDFARLIQAVTQAEAEAAERARRYGPDDRREAAS